VTHLTHSDVMRRIAFTTMSLETTTRERARVLCLAFMLAMAPGFAADAPAPNRDAAAATRAAPGDTAIVAAIPMEIEPRAARTGNSSSPRRCSPPIRAPT